MSCGHPHDDCASVLEHVYEYIDHEMDDDDCATVKQHLDDCSPCLAEYGLEQAVKSLVHRCCPEVAPEELRAKVLSKIRQVQAGAVADGQCAPEESVADAVDAAAEAKQSPALS